MASIVETITQNHQIKTPVTQNTNRETVAKKRTMVNSYDNWTIIPTIFISN